MAHAFDPYARWLGIAPEQQPPSHYRLLEIDCDVNDRQVIREAAERRMDQLHAFESDDRPELIERLLGEIVTARDTLINPHARAKYDRGLLADERLGEQHAARRSESSETAAVGRLIHGDSQPSEDDTSHDDPSTSDDGLAGSFVGIEVGPSTSPGRGGGRRTRAQRGGARRATGQRAEQRAAQQASQRGANKQDQTTRNMAIVAGVGGGIVLLCIVMIAAFGGGGSEKKKNKQAPSVAKKSTRSRFAGLSTSARRRARKDAPTQGAALASQSKIADLVEQLNTDSPDVQVRACGELGSIGLGARFARNQLIALARGHPDPRVREAAAAAATKIEAALRKYKVPFDDPFSAEPPAKAASPATIEPPLKKPSSKKPVRPQP